MHSTQDELDYIEHIGSWSDEKARKGKVWPAEMLMENYLIAARKRKSWKGIDKKECVRLATHLLSVIRG